MKKDELVKEIHKEAKKQAKKRVSMTKEEMELNHAAFEAAKMPVEFKDEDVELGVQEIDIRNLSDRNFKQMVFRLLCVQTSQTRQLTQIIIDLERLIILDLTTKGIPAEQIGEKINEIIEKLEKSSEELVKAAKGTQA